jgi:hypothetical protein
VLRRTERLMRARRKGVLALGVGGSETCGIYGIQKEVKDYKQKRSKNVGGIKVDEYRVQWRVPLNTVLNFCVT